jgi:Asp-tRNA(Asn)/Glu-tRNA(Gln) amidotransferase A subunit family amidase
METNNKTYELKSVKLPYLSGLPLRIFTSLLEGPLSKLLLPNLFKSSGIAKFQKQQFDDTPTMLPISFTKDADPEYKPITIHDWPTPKKQESDFRFRTVNDYARMYRDGSTTPLEVAEKVLAAIKESEKGDRPIRAFIAVNDKDVLRQAKAATERFKSGQPLSMLDGVPVAVKDELDMVPYPTTVGTSFQGTKPALEDATIVGRMRTAGALLIGKTNMHEIGIGVTGFNAHHGTVRNPYNPAHFSGGSSSGSAAAVAAGFCPVALGADGGGSIRIPSAFCGLVGIKSTFGRMSEFGAAPLCWSLAHVGPIASTATDAALVYSVLAGPDPKDSISLKQPSPKLSNWENTDLSDLTIGIYWPWFHHATYDVVSACEKTVEQFIALGAKVKEVELPDLEAARIAHSITIASEMAHSQAIFKKDHEKDYSYEVRINLALARNFSSLDYIKSQKVRTRLINNFNKTFEKVDLILTPTTGLPAPAIAQKSLPNGDSDLSTLIEIMRFATPANLTGLPAISFPVGYNENNLPLGMQAISKAWDENRLFRLAIAAEQIVQKQRPQIHFNLLPKD